MTFLSHIWHGLTACFVAVGAIALAVAVAWVLVYLLLWLTALSGAGRE